MQTIIDILRGVIIGIANIVPGVSGGTLAVSMGIYNTLIQAVNDFLKTPFKAIKMVWKYALGMVLGVLISIFAVSILFQKAPIIASMLFIGLIVGSVPTTMNKIEIKKLKLRDIITIAVVIIVFILLGIIEGKELINISNASNNWLIMFLLGIVIAMSIVIPGISGSAILMALGCYTSVMTMVKDTIQYALTFNFIEAIYTGKTLIILVLGVGIGIFLTAKLINNLMKKYTDTVYWGIVALMVSTPFIVLLGLDYTGITVVEMILSIIMLIVGSLLAKKLSKGEEETK